MYKFATISKLNFSWLQYFPYIVNDWKIKNGLRSFIKAFTMLDHINFMDPLPFPPKKDVFLIKQWKYLFTFLSDQ